MIGGAALLLAAMPAHAQMLFEHEDGRVYFKRSCAGNYSFSFFDGGRLQRGCIESTPEVSLERFVQMSRDHDCPGQVRVVRGTLEDGIVRATVIEKVRGCVDGGRRRRYG